MSVDPAARLLAVTRERYQREGPRHYTPIDTTGLHVGVVEILEEAEVAQRLLDVATIRDGNPQGAGDLDQRVARAVWELTETRGRLGRIAQNHQQGQGPAGMVDGVCTECDHRWPCPTYVWADGGRDTLAAWDPADDDATEETARAEETDHG